MNRLEQIREAIPRDASNGETAYADRAWLLGEHDRLAGALRIIRMMAGLPKAQSNGVAANDLCAICDVALNPPPQTRGGSGVCALHSVADCFQCN